MRVKRYVVDSMPDALQQIRTDLGKDAVILNTKEIRSGGFLGLFSKKKIEVIAATDSSSTEQAAIRKQQAAARQFQDVLAAAGSPTSTGGTGSVAVLESAPPVMHMQEEQQLQQPWEHPPAVTPPTPAASQPSNMTAPALGRSAYGAQASASTAETVKESAAVSQAQEESILLKELKAMRHMMQQMSEASKREGQPVRDPILTELSNRLLDQEIERDTVEEWMVAIEARVAESGEALSYEFALQELRELLAEVLASDHHKPLSPATRVAHFVGPTGVGKTTTIAKLAAEQVLKHHRKVGLITSDTYRIAAVDQLKTYATILGVPLEVVVSPPDLRKAFERMADRDIIFMDTAGRNFRNEMYVSELNALLHASGQSETYLVMSLTTKYKDMKAIAKNFSKFKVDKVLFTKRDETDSFGSIINLKKEFPFQLSYITNGQNVPEDFAIASEREIIDLILEDRSDE